MSSGRLQEVKNNEKLQCRYFKKCAAVAYERWSFSKGSNYRALTGKIWCFG